MNKVDYTTGMHHHLRVIPRLDIKGPNLVKGIHLEGLRVMGRPEEFAAFYYEEGADELIYVDIVASLYGRNSLVDIIERTSRRIFIPLTVGGGLRSIADITTVLRAGADKVALNTAAVNNPNLVRDAAQRFGSSTIVISIEAKRQPGGGYIAYTDNGRENTGKDVIAWARQAAELGAGEILLTSVDQEGTGLGYDIELTRAVAQAVPIPVIACGGAGVVDHVLDVINNGKADAVSLSSMPHYHFLKNKERQGDLPTEGNVDFLRSKASFSRVQPVGIADLKVYLHGQGVSCRSWQTISETDSL